MSTRDWNVPGPARTEALVIRWTTRNAPTGIRPDSENSL